MKFSPPLCEALLQKRYKRFLADVLLPDGQLLTVHCPNTGSMLGCAVPGSKVWFSDSGNPSRRYPHTLEMVEVNAQFLVGVNTSRANRLVEEAITGQQIKELCGYDILEREAKLQTSSSRLDFRLVKSSTTDRVQEVCYVEVKNVTLSYGEGMGYFPDAVTERGTKHLHELLTLKQAGHRAVLLFCVQHEGVQAITAEKNIDPLYAKTLQEVMAQGVEVLAYRAILSPHEIRLQESLPFVV